MEEFSPSMKEVNKVNKMNSEDIHMIVTGIR